MEAGTTAVAYAARSAVALVLFELIAECYERLSTGTLPGAMPFGHFALLGLSGWRAAAACLAATVRASGFGDARRTRIILALPAFFDELENRCLA